MPQQPHTRCSHTGCHNKTLKDGLCTQHQRKAWQHPSAHARLINPTKWHKTRQTILKRDHHTCVRCGQPGNIIDHITPVGANGALYDPNNLQTLCTTCNNHKNQEDRKNYPNIYQKH